MTDTSGTVRSWLRLLAMLVVVAAVAALGNLFRPGEWYAALNRPPLTPPPWLFGPVWTVLYAMIAVAGWLLSERPPSAQRRVALTLYFGQLVLNGLWSWLFFGLQSPGLALIDIVLLWGLIAATIVAARPLSTTAAALLVPYWLWVTFAVYLNAGFWQLN